MDPIGSSVAIRDATPDDAPELERIEAASFSTDRLSRRSILRDIASPTVEVLVARAREAVAGYAMVFRRRTSRIARLYSIAVAPDFRGRGLARKLLDAAEGRATARDCDRMRLEVREDNLAAIALYEQRGYRAFGRHAEYYQDGSAALRFEKQLAPASAPRSRSAQHEPAA